MLKRLAENRGVFGTEKLATWLEELLASRIHHRTGPDGRVAFQDVDTPLFIIATDVASGIKLFSRKYTPKESISDAVAASASIPFFFMPKELQEASLVDGGLVSNFPAWVFDEERHKCGPLIPTFGFDLVTARPVEPITPFPFAESLFRVLLDGDRLLEVRAVENLHVIPLQVHCSTWNFDLTPVQKDKLYHDGLRGARDFFLRQVGPRDPDHMRKILELVHGHMLGVLKKLGCHLRVNVIMQTNSKRLRVLYSCNMEKDADDRLELESKGGASGRCWSKKDFVICDLEDAKRTYGKKWYMNKYQQALVRPTLKSLLCVPIFDQSKYDKTKPNSKNPILGVLNFDSDEDFRQDFAQPIESRKIT